MVIIENARGLTFKRNATLLAHVRECLRVLYYSIHIRILCTSQSAVPQSRGRCYVVGIRGPRVGFKWPKVLKMVDLKHVLNRSIVKTCYNLNERQTELMGKLPDEFKGRLEKDWYCIDIGCSLKWASCSKGKCPCLTRSRAMGTLLEQASPRPYSVRAWGHPRASKQCHLAHE